MNPTVEYIASHPEAFSELNIEEQLGVVAELSLYWATRKLDALESEGKLRVDSSLGAQRCYAYEKYWLSKAQNIKKIAELEMARTKRGI